MGREGFAEVDAGPHSDGTGEHPNELVIMGDREKP